MKKFTLLALAAMAAGTQMGYADELPGGIITSTKENPVYYTISNMRADRLSYLNGDIYDADHDVINHDNAVGQVGFQPAYLPNEDETPELYTFPYMGLALCENKFWTAFSVVPQVMNRQTIYWWFENGSAKGSVLIHNAVIDGALKNKADKIYGRPSMSFSETAKQSYYVLPLSEEQIEDLELTDDPYGQNAFALSKSKSLTDASGTVTDATKNSCLDMNNYLIFNYTSDLQKVDEDGELVFETVNKTDADGNVITDPETGEPVTEEVPVYEKYGFAGVDLTWNPLNTNGTDNEKYNNGSLFQVKKVEDVEAVNKAIKEYEEIVKESYRKSVLSTLEAAKKDAIARLTPLRNLPALYGDQTDKLDAIIADINNMTVDPSGVQTIADVDMWEATIEQNMEGQYLRAMALAGNGTVIRLQQMLALRDWEDYDALGEDNDENLGNAYLSAAGLGQVKYNNSMEEVGYPAVTCLLNADTTCDWTMEWVAGQGYRLKNGENYIRTRGNWEPMAELFYDALGADPEEFEEGDNIFNHIDANQMSWATTTDANEAAVFTFTANNTEIQNATLSDAEQEAFDSYGEELGYEDEDALFVTTNIAHLQAPDADGNLSYLCRDTAAQNYIVCSWAAGNRYFANPNCWKIEKVAAGEEVPDGIEEINATAKVQGIYDLQGRKVAKATKGLYIINGVKTLVK